MNNALKLFVYQKTLRFRKEDEKTGELKEVKLPKHMCAYKDKILDLKLTKESEAQLIVKMKDNGLTYPVLLTLTDDDYFITTKKITTKNGTFTKHSVVVTNFTDIEQTTFKKKSLDDIISEMTPTEEVEKVSNE